MQSKGKIINIYELTWHPAVTSGNSEQSGHGFGAGRTAVEESTRLLG